MWTSHVSQCSNQSSLPATELSQSCARASKLLFLSICTSSFTTAPNSLRILEAPKTSAIHYISPWQTKTKTGEPWCFSTLTWALAAPRDSSSTRLSACSNEATRWSSLRVTAIRIIVSRRPAMVSSYRLQRPKKRTGKSRLNESC